MPIHDGDWSDQFFRGVPCPEDVHIPGGDVDAWRWNPKHNWVYNKIAIATSQGIEAAPHGVPPRGYPIFSKPITNLYGMGAGSRLIGSEAEYHEAHQPGHMWMSLLDGEHISSDAAVEKGRVRWWRHAHGLPGGEGMFDYWTVFAGSRPEIETYCGAWIEQHLSDYTGLVNMETIGARMIELHLRMTDQWPDLYGGRPWVEALIRLYADGVWRFEDASRKEGYSLALFGPHTGRYRHPPKSLQQELLRQPGMSSLQFTFHEGVDNALHSNPPGGFRLSVINCWELEAGRRVRQRLAEFFDLAAPVNIREAA